MNCPLCNHKCETIDLFDVSLSKSVPKQSCTECDWIDEGDFKIAMADDSIIESLDEYVQSFLKTLGDVLDQPGIACAFVTDESRVSDFLDYDSENTEVLQKISKRVGFKVRSSDYIYEVAIKIRDKGV